MRMPFAPVTILPGSAPLAWSRACVDGCMKWLRSCLHRCAQTRTDGGALHRSRPAQDFSCITSTCRHCRKASTGCDIGQWQPQIAEAKIFGFDKRREALRATFAAQARCLHAAEWNGRAGEFDAVDRHHG